MIKYGSKIAISELKFSFSAWVKKNLWKIVLSVLLVLVAVVCGIVIAIKKDLSGALKTLQNISLKRFEDGVVGSSTNFLARGVSILFNVLLLLLFSMSRHMFPLAEILFCYRGYLFGINYALIFVFYGIGGFLPAILVILPCQIITFCALLLFYLLLSGKDYCGIVSKKWVVIVVGIGILLLVNVVETALLYLLGGKVILVL